MNIEEQLKELLLKSTAAPVLFVGSGLSKRYLGTEDWNGMLERFSKGLKREYAYYKSKGGEKNLPKVASVLAEDFHDYWWEEESYEEQREIHKKDIINYDSPLKIEISSYLDDVQIIEQTCILDEIKLLKKVFKERVIDTIITTNWDKFLEEEIFTDYDVLIGQEEILALGNVGIEEIYKIHGCISSPNSLVLTDEDYSGFNERNAYMAAKLLTTFIEHPVIFLGYALNDTNIQDILVNIGKCLPDKFEKKLENNLIFIQPIFDEREDSFTRSSITIDNVNIPRIVIEVKDYSKIYNALLAYQRKFPIKLVKLMQERLYEIVIQNNPHNQIIAGTVENLSEIREADFVVGMGINKQMEEAGVSIGLKGIIGLEYEEVLRDVLDNHIINDNTGYAFEIVQTVLPKKPFFPICKYIYQSGMDITSEHLDGRLKQRLSKSFEEQFVGASLKKKKETIRETYKSVLDIQEDGELDEGHKIIFIPLLEEANINIEELEIFIRERIELINDDNLVQRSNFRKLIKIYDWLKYRKLLLK